MTINSKRRVAIVGTGHRGTGTWGRELLADCGEWVEMVGLCDRNPLRLERARAAIGTTRRSSPIWRDACRDAARHADRLHARRHAMTTIIVAALEAGVDVVTEKPMTTTAETCRRILEAERAHRPARRRHLQLPLLADRAADQGAARSSGAIGEIASVDFHWYLDVAARRRLFPPLACLVANSGSLFVHKATHHFDLLNWYLEAEPSEVFARGELRHYGRDGPVPRRRAARPARTPRSATTISTSARIPGSTRSTRSRRAEDGYFRDACVFREDIDIPDTMSAAIRYANGVQVVLFAQYLHADRGLSPGLQRPAAAGSRSASTSASPGSRPTHDEILLARNFGAGRAHHRPAPARRPFRRRPGAAADAVRAGHGATRSASGPARAPAPCRCSAASQRWKAPGTAHRSPCCRSSRRPERPE